VSGAAAVVYVSRSLPVSAKRKTTAAAPLAKRFSPENLTMRLCIALALVVPLLSGCGSATYQTAPVSGRVTLDGQPLAHAAVVFQPVAGKDNNPGPGSGGTTDADGRYTLSVVGTGSRGAVIGKHKVHITLAPTEEDPADDRPKRHKELPAIYNRKTKLECEVPAGGIDKADFDLKSGR
jgi:hypothetical protein